MCTVIFNWNPEGPFATLSVGANRDESVSRPSDGFDYRGSILCPLDKVLGGTWIGVNNSGVFVAITNRDDVEHVHGRKSRGILTLVALRLNSVNKIQDWVLDLDGSHYNGFQLIAIDKNDGVVLAGDGKNTKKHPITPGLHIVTGFGIDTWNIPRCQYVKSTIPNLTDAFLLPSVLSHHGTNKRATYDVEVCVHDPSQTHITVSSCIIVGTPTEFITLSTDTAPCIHTGPWHGHSLKII